MNIKKTLLLSLLVTVAGVCRAQGYYDDDIYFDSSKDKDKNIELAKKQKEAARKRAANAVILYPVADFPAADTYAPEGTSTRSVDEYNRRGIFAKDSLAHDSLGNVTDFAYTRQIERFYNPEIVKGSADAELAGLYYAQPAYVNISVNVPYSTYWGYPYGWSGWYDPWYYSSYWGWGGYWNNPWHWGPGWGPSLAWGPGYWGPAWSWGPSWGWGPGYWGPAWGWGGAISRPYNPRHPGANRVDRPSGNHRYPGRPGGNYRPSYNNNRHSSPAYRPGGNRHENNGNYRPGNTNNNSNNRDYNSYTRPGRNNRNSSTFNNNNSGSYRSNGGSFNGGGRSGGGTGRGRH